MKKLKEIALPRHLMEVKLDAATFDPKARTVEVLWYAGAKVQRFSFFEGPYELQFSMDPKAIRMQRLSSGRAPFKGDHFGDLASQIGVIDKAWLEDGVGHAMVRFSSRAEVQPLIQDIREGILQNVSMEAQIHELDDVTPKGAKQKSFLAIDWEPMAVALVAVGADPDAQVLAAAEKYPCKITSSLTTPGAPGASPKGDTMKIKVRLLETNEELEIEESEFDETLHVKDVAAPKPVPRSTERTMKRTVDDAIEADKVYSAEVMRVAEYYGLSKLWATSQINLQTSMEQVVKLATAERAKRVPRLDNSVSVGDDFESLAWRGEQMAVALAARGTRKRDIPEQARQYASFSIVEMAQECLSFVGRGKGLDRRQDAAQIIELALHSNSDFPLLLANALNKILLPMYDQANPTYRQVAAQKTFNDFRAHTFLRAGDFPIPLLVGENGEYQSGTLTETGESVTCYTYGRILGISRQIMINDDTGAFADIATMAGRRAADFENYTFFTNCILAGSEMGPTLSTSNIANTVYHANHKNVTAGGAISNTLLGSARALLMAQTSPDGLKLNVPAAIVLCSPTTLTATEQLLTAITAPSSAANVNIFAGRLRAIGDANLGTSTRFYVLAEPSVLPNYVYGFLGGAAGPRTALRDGFRTDGIEFKLSLDFGCGAVDYRGGATGAGA
jgi:hypothetical protein